MLSWERQRKLLFITGVAVFLAALFGAYGFFALRKMPDCSNRVKDGDERGIDCGGNCIRICKEDAAAPVIHFARAVEVREGVWGAVAYGENRNSGAGSRSAPYLFKLYDEHNSLLYERRGVTFIPPRKVFAVFEGRMFSGDRIPTRATFAFTEEVVFERMSEPLLSIDTKDFEVGNHKSSLRTIVRNPTRIDINGIEVVALLFGADGNIVGASSTFVSALLAGDSAALIFTWPRELPRPARTEVLYTVPGR
jgi:hypothetical protein